MAVPVIAQVSVLFLLRTVQVSVNDAERWAIHSKDVILQADEIQRLAIEAVASQRGAVVTGDPGFRDTSESLDRDLRQRIKMLATNVQDNPDQQKLVLALGDEIDALETWLASQRDLVRQGRRDEAAAHIRDLEGSNHLADVRGGLIAFLDREERIGQQRSTRLRQATWQSQVLTVLAAIVSLGVACVLAHLFSRAIGSRFAAVTSNAERLARGESVTGPLSGSDEIARLDRVLHDTARRLAAASAAAVQAHQELKAHVGELAQLNLELKQQTEENETFIYSVSHDLRSPLVNLQGFSKELTMACAQLNVLLENDSLPEDFKARAAAIVDRDIAESLGFIKTAVSRSSHIIDSLLRLSRVGRVEYRWQRVNVRRTVKNVIDSMRATIGERKAELTVHPLAEIWGDPTAIEQIFANLIGNAVAYLDPERPGRIEIGMIAPAGEGDAPGPVSRTYYVRDNGLGLPESATSKIFTAFQRHHAQHATGEGVGLALVRRIVERHGGRIWVESTEGVGSTFYVELPVEPPPAGGSPSEAGADQNPDVTAQASAQA